MPFSGVRISWLTVARKRDFARLAASALSRAAAAARNSQISSRNASISDFRPRRERACAHTHSAAPSPAAKTPSPSASAIKTQNLASPFRVSVPELLRPRAACRRGRSDRREPPRDGGGRRDSAALQIRDRARELQHAMEAARRQRETLRSLANQRGSAGVEIDHAFNELGRRARIGRPARRAPAPRSGRAAIRAPPRPSPRPRATLRSAAAARDRRPVSAGTSICKSKRSSSGPDSRA